MEHLVKRHRINPQDRRAFIDQALADHFHRHPQRRLGSALAAAGLQHPQLATLNGKLDILHILVMQFQQVEHLGQLGVGDRHGFFHRERLGVRQFAGAFSQILRGSNARDHVLSLRVDQPFAVISPLAGGRVAGKGNAGGRCVAHIAEHHCLNVDRGAPITRNVVEAAINLSPIAVPTVEHSSNRAGQLRLDILRERATKFALDNGLILANQCLPIISLHLNIGKKAVVFLDDFQCILEQMVVEPQHHIGIHLDEPAIAVPGEPCVARCCR